MRPGIRPLVGLAAALAALLAAAPTAAGQYIEGIDVSNHQHEIRWDRVPDEIRFAFVKASEGTTFVDAWYERNRTLAKQHGKVVGAYHFARPGGGSPAAARRDARAEARFFHRIADPQPDDLRPVLDLEVTGGLPPSLLKRWTRTFLRRLENLTGAKGLIYTSPSFWRTAMGDSRWFARNGYKALWIAHWQTSDPDVPASNWGGHGWTFWQYTSCGRVAGIEGCVDRNRYRYRRLKRFLVDPGAERAPGGPERPAPDADGPTCRGEPATIVGTPGEDTINGTAGDDVIVARAGDDAVAGRGGHDLVCAGPGDDLVRGGRGRDRIRGQAGADDLRGGRGGDDLRGGRDGDALRGGRHGDALRGNKGDDLLGGGRGHDELRGGTGTDTCRGGRGSDTSRSCER